MTKWFSPKEKLPPQGKKVLHMINGDLCVCQRFKDKWLPIPFTDSKYASYDEPDFWADIDPPKPYTGFMKAIIDGIVYTVDELEEKTPSEYEKFINDFVNEIVKQIDEKKS